MHSQPQHRNDGTPSEARQEAQPTPHAPPPHPRPFCPLSAFLLLFYFFFTVLFKLYSSLHVVLLSTKLATVVHPGVFHTGAHTHLPTRILRLPLGLSLERSLQNRPAGTTPVGLISRTAVCQFHRFDWNVCLDRHAAPTQVTGPNGCQGVLSDSNTSIRPSARRLLYIGLCKWASVGRFFGCSQPNSSRTCWTDDRSNQGVAAWLARTGLGSALLASSVTFSR